MVDTEDVEPAADAGRGGGGERKFVGRSSGPGPEPGLGSSSEEEWNAVDVDGGEDGSVGGAEDSAATAALMLADT